jgi:hypothetical protein
MISLKYQFILCGFSILIVLTISTPCFPLCGNRGRQTTGRKIFREVHALHSAQSEPIAGQTENTLFKTKKTGKSPNKEKPLTTPGP